MPEKKAGPAESEPTKPPAFEEGIKQLEAIVKEMESGDLPLERALELFERGMQLSAGCRKQLEEAETRVEILMKRGGEVRPQPFDQGSK
jgi:exodeoxyribonuclease VII small subunit